jgi:hypothetical protein
VRVSADVSLKVGGTVVGLLGGFLTGVWEVFLSPVYAGKVPLPVAPLLAIAGNLALIWFVRTVTRSNGLALLPGIAWFATMIIGTTRTTEGDVPIPSNDYMGLIAILAGAGAWALAAYRLALRRAYRQAPPVKPTTAPAPDSAAQPVWKPPAPGARPTQPVRKSRR